MPQQHRARTIIYCLAALSMTGAIFAAQSVSRNHVRRPSKAVGIPGSTALEGHRTAEIDPPTYFGTPSESADEITIENECVKYVIGADGQNLHFVDRRTNTDYCRKSRFARVLKAGKEYGSTAVSYVDGQLTVKFGEADVTAVVKVIAEKRYFVFEVVSVTGESVERLTFLDLPLTLQGRFEEPFAACALALNLKTDVLGIPGLMRHARASCYPMPGLVGAQVALVGCPTGELRDTLKTVVSKAPDLPKSSIGGPWALDAPINRGSYLFCGRVSEENVDDYIRLASSLGITQLNLHAARYGDWQPYPNTYPRGRASVKAVLDKIHAAGMSAGLHTYSFFINKSCPYVTPVPDPRLGKDAVFTLAEPLTAKATTVPVIESTKEMSTTTGFFVRNSVTLQVDDELITYKTISKEPPFAFTECQRVACGTRVAEHAKGAKVHHMRQCFHLFLPDGESTLFTEVAAGLADFCDAVGFDMVYLDALDGADAVAGAPHRWYYSAKFVYEFTKRLKKPLVLEASAFPHHLWVVRTRTGAWDHPVRSHKKFIDIHAKANEANARMFLPGHMGWWAFKTWTGPLGEPTYPDDIEYLCCKCLGMGIGLSIQGINPSNVSSMPALPRLAAITRKYENLRHANYFTDKVKEKLRAPGEDYTLFQDSSGEWQFRSVQYDKHKVECLDDWSSQWKTTNKFGRQPAGLRIEALMSAKPYDTPGAMTVADFADAGEFPIRSTATGIKADLKPSTAQVKLGKTSACCTASNTLSTRHRTWAQVGKTFSPPVNLTGGQALGVWVHGDGKGEVLNVQLRSPTHLSRSYGEHYITVDFTGWRYFELIEQEGQRYADYSWPYGGLYQIYRESVRYASVENLNLYYNNLPPSDSVTCFLSPIKALPTVKARLRDPAITINGQTLRFPVTIESGCHLEFRPPAECKLYGPKGELIQEVKPQGDVPTVEAGTNDVKFDCQCDEGVRPRAYVSIVTQGDVLRGRNPDDKIRSQFLRRLD